MYPSSRKSPAGVFKDEHATYGVRIYGLCMPYGFWLWAATHMYIYICNIAPPCERTPLPVLPVVHWSEPSKRVKAPASKTYAPGSMLNKCFWESACSLLLHCTILQQTFRDYLQAPKTVRAIAMLIAIHKHPLLIRCQRVTCQLWMRCIQRAMCP